MTTPADRAPLLRELFRSLPRYDVDLAMHEAGHRPTPPAPLPAGTIARGCGIVGFLGVPGKDGWSIARSTVVRAERGIELGTVRLLVEHRPEFGAVGQVIGAGEMSYPLDDENRSEIGRALYVDFAIIDSRNGRDICAQVADRRRAGQLVGLSVSGPRIGTRLRADGTEEIELALNEVSLTDAPRQVGARLLSLLLGGGEAYRQAAERAEERQRAREVPATMEQRMAAARQSQSVWPAARREFTRVNLSAPQPPASTAAREKLRAQLRVYAGILGAARFEKLLDDELANGGRP